MKVIVRKWIQTCPSTPSIGRLKTTVEIHHPAFTTSVTIDGQFKRKEAIRRVAEHLALTGTFGFGVVSELRKMCQ